MDKKLGSRKWLGSWPGLETSISLPQILDPDPDSSLGDAKALKVDSDSDSVGFRLSWIPDSDSVLSRIQIL